jgi:hypothetical protein
LVGSLAQEQVEAAIRRGRHRGAHPEVCVYDPADSVARVPGDEVEIARREGKAVDVVELRVLPVQRDE